MNPLFAAAFLVAAAQGPLLRETNVVEATVGSTLVLELAGPVDGASVVYGNAGLPVGATFDESEAVLVWTPTAEQEGEHRIDVWAARDDGVESTTVTVRVASSGLEAPPISYGGCDCQTFPKPVLEFPAGNSLLSLALLGVFVVRRRRAE